MSAKMNTKRITRLAFFTAIALILSLLESWLTPLFAFAPGAKMGLSNAAILVALVLLGFPDALIVQLVRCVLGGIITGGISGLMFSVPAGMMSLFVMALLYRFAFPKVTLLGISFLGAMFHNYTQLTVAWLVYPDINYALLLANYLLASVAAGLFVGFSSHFVIKYLPSAILKNK